MTGGKRTDRVWISIGDRLIYDDDRDHHDNAFKRLLRLSEDEVLAYCEIVADLCYGGPTPLEGSQYDLDATLKTLGRAWRRFRPSAEVEHGIDSRATGKKVQDPMRIWASATGTDRTAIMVGQQSPPHARLVDRATLEPVASATIDYEEDYFEGSRPRAGYAGYAAQGDWRMDKARRQVRQVSAILQYEGAILANPATALDVGSGYGFFRAALGEADWSHSGLEVSHHAARAAEELFGMATHVGSLESMVYTGATFDIITMWDFLEHVDDPTAVLTSVRHALNGSGTLFVRTPNLAAAELGVFGNDYHSLKREHLHMFSPGSLAETLLASGFRPTFLTSESHLLQGFLGDRVARLAAEQRGSDLLAAAVKLGSE